MPTKATAGRRGRCYRGFATAGRRWCSPRGEVTPVPLFIVEREFAEQFDPDEQLLRVVDEYNAAHDLKWLTSFLSADKKRTYCLYECADIEVLRRHAQDLGLPADVITPVTQLAR